VSNPGTVVAVDAELELGSGVDSRAPGGAVTVALCGAWDHDGPCRWPHHSRIEPDDDPARLRTVVVVPPDEATEVVARIEQALRDDASWSVVRFATGEIDAAEQALADRLAGAT
jgi:hypothetical protein